MIKRYLLALIICISALPALADDNLKNLISDVGVQDVTIDSEWTFASKPSTSYYGYDNLQGDQVMIFRPGLQGHVVQVNVSYLKLYFSAYSSVNCSFKVINGAGTAGTVLYEASRTNQSEPLDKYYRSSDPSGAVTILFNTNGQRGQGTTYGFSGTASLYQAPPMTFSSARAEQASVDDVYSDDKEMEILHLTLTTAGALNPLTLDNLVVDMKGCADMVDTVKLLSTGTTGEYVQPVTCVASAKSDDMVVLRPQGAFYIPEGSSHYWLAFDMKSKLREGAGVDAKINGLTISGTRYEVQNADPAGARIARDIYRFHGPDTVVVDSIVHFFDNGGPADFYTREYSGAVVFRPKNPDKALRLHFNYFIAGYNDELQIYNGSEVADTNLLLRLYGDKAETKDLVSTAADGSLTAFFKTGEYGLMLEGWDIDITEFSPDPLVVDEVKVESVARATVYPGSEQNQMLHITINVKGEKGTLTLNNLTFNTNGSEPGLIRNAAVWSSGRRSTFAGADLLGNAVPTDNAFTIDGNYTLSQPGEYHFWLTCDIASGVAAGLTLKTSLQHITVNSASCPPSIAVTASATTRSGMHGTYIIGISDAADYKTFNQAVRTLADRGVDGPVTIKVESGLYEETVNLLPVPGASEANRIVFTSAEESTDKVTIRFGEEKKTLSQGVVNFTDGTSYITLRNMTITSDAYVCPGIIYLQGGCMHNAVERCLVRGHRSTSYSERVVLIYTTYLEEDDKNCNYFSVADSRLEGGYYGVAVTGITNLNHTIMAHDVAITGNTFVDQSCKALQAMGICDGLTVRGNTFLNDGADMTATYHNMDIYRCTGRVTIADNIIDITAAYMMDSDTPTTASTADAIYIRDITNTRASHKLVYNNDIRLNGLAGTNHGLYGIYVADNTTGQSIDIAHNTIVLTGTGYAYSAAIMTDAPTPGSLIRGNLLQNRMGSTLLRGTSASTFPQMIIENNALHTTGSVWALLPAQCNSIADIAAATTQSAGIAEAAAFLADDMHELLRAGSLQSAPRVDYISVDLLGNARAETTTIGAYEYIAQHGTPAWTKGYPRISDITTSTALMELSTDKAAVVRYILLETSQPMPADSLFAKAQSVNLHTMKPAAVSFGGLREEKDYVVYAKLTSYLGQSADSIVCLPFRTLSPETRYPNPVAVITHPDTTEGREGEMLTLQGVATGGMEPLSYLWTDGSGTILSRDTIMTVDLSRSQTYRFTVIDNRGKENYDEINITVRGHEYVASFEDLYLEPESHWPGTHSNRSFFSGSYEFDNYNGTNSGYSTWGKFTYSNSSSNAYRSLEDQYNSAPGGGVNGSNTFGVGFMDSYVGATYLTVTHRADGDTIRGLWITNSAWVLDAVRNGDGLSLEEGGFREGDYYKVSITGLLNNHVVDSVLVYTADFRASLPQDRYALDTWQWVDLSKLGKVNKLWFRYDGTKRNQFGITTPAYFCIDNVGDPCPWEDLSEQLITVSHNSDPKSLRLAPLFGFDPDAGTITYSISAPQGLAALDDDIPDKVNVCAATPAHGGSPFTLLAKATQQGRSRYLRIPVKVDYTTGVDALPAQAATVYPLPAHDVLNIATELTGYTAELFDGRGQQLLRQTNLQGTTQLRLPPCTPGIYILRIISTRGVISRKIPVR